MASDGKAWAIALQELNSKTGPEAVINSFQGLSKSKASQFHIHSVDVYRLIINIFQMLQEQSKRRPDPIATPKSTQT